MKFELSCEYNPKMEYEAATKWLNFNNRGCLLSFPKHSPRKEQQETHKYRG
jgi:hypothetical protein